MRPRKFVSCDCETDPFLHGRVPTPFVWGLYDGKVFNSFEKTAYFVEAIADRNIIVYAHNGGKFDFMFLLPFIKETNAQIIGGRIVSMYLGNAELRCSYAAVPESMKSIQKKDIEYWKLEAHCRGEHMPEIMDYLKSDCVYLYDLMLRYREQAGTRKTIAANALAYSKKLGIDPGKTPHTFDKKYRSFYYGGRCECFQPGTHKDIRMIDIHSAYPFAMTHDHATGADFYRQSDLRGLTPAQVQRSFLTIECMSHGAFPKRFHAKGENCLSFPHEYDEYKVTGWEYLVAKEFGLIENEKIHEVRYTEDTINFTPYVNYWYEYKASHPKEVFPIEYTIGKIMMNSLYGKLAQNPERYYDYRIVCGGNAVDNANGWILHTEYASHEIHRRESLWKHKHFRDPESGELYSSGHEWEQKRLYNNVATGASITGFTRAHLLRAIATLGFENVLYADTDGIAAKAAAPFDRLSFSDQLGDWGLDGIGHIGHFAGKKTYGIRGLKPNGKPLEKVACKGGRLAFQDIERLIAGETILWQNDAPTFSIDGTAKFITRAIRATARLET